MKTSMERLSYVRSSHADETIALAGGVFDLLHPGHIDLFKRMKRGADIGVIALSSDARVKQRKGSLRPIHDENTRLEIVNAIRFVDYTLLAPEPDPADDEVPTIKVMRALRPDIFLSSEPSWLEHSQIFEELGIEFQLVPRFNEEVSTSRTINSIVQSHAAQL